LLVNEFKKALFKIFFNKIDYDFWRLNGFLVLENFFTSEKIDAINKIQDSLWVSAEFENRKTVVDVFIGSPDERRMCIKDAPLHAKNFPYKINDLYLENSTVRDLILDKRLSKILSMLLDGPPLVCNTLNFTYGSQQPPHTDSLYMTPPKDLNLVATWVALEDCDSDAGPLEYYPGSHLIPPFLFSNNKMTAIPSEMEQYQAYMKNELILRGIKPKVFCAKKGDLFIWHSQLFHGGSQIRNFELTRKSLVTHYFRYGDIDCLARRQNEYGYWMDRERQKVV
jgi:ectoine hydroxylase-related dioxygenase (phytanoyl-CoA dioxygenase family)